MKHVQNQDTPVLHDQDGTGTSEHFSKSTWKNIADIAETVKLVIMMLAGVAISNSRVFWAASDSKKTVYLGTLYDDVFSPVTEKQTQKKPSGKKHEAKNTAEKFRKENEKTRILQSFKKIEDFFARCKKNSWDFKSLPSELKSSMEHIAFFFTLAMSYAKTVKTGEENIYSLIYAILRFFNEVDENQINRTILANLKNEFESFKTHINFLPEKFITTYFKLTVTNSFDSIFEGSSGFSPMGHQKEILQHIVANYKEGFLLKYKVLAGYGKTTTIVPIAKATQLLDRKSRVVFCCNIDSVRQEVAKLLLHTGITFGIVAHSYWKKEVRDWYIKKHPSCRVQDSELQVLITGPEFCCSVVQRLESNGHSVTLFLDDFTVGADDVNSQNLKFNGEILSNPPKRMIVSSATLPEDEKMSNVYSFFSNKHPNANISIPAITCEKIKIGCDLRTLSQCSVTPFTGVSSPADLKRIFSCVLANPFLKNFCTYSGVKIFDREFAKHRLGRFGIGDFASNFLNLNANAISEFFANSLMKIDEFDDVSEEEITEIFSKKGGGDTIEFSELLNDWTTMFPGMTLIATPNPQKFLSNFSQFLEKIRANFNLEKETLAFDEKIEIHERNLELKEKADASAKEKKVVRDENGRAEVQQQECSADAFDKIERPSFKFPNFLKVNSKEHCDFVCEKFGVKCDHNGNHRECFPDGEELVDNVRLIDLRIDEDLILLLLSGIGVWSKNITSPEYKSLVLRLASNNKLAYVIADETICYGTNYPFNRVIVTEEFSQVHSMETIFQVIARAGRLGLIYKAEAYIPDSLLPRFKEYSMTNVDSSFDEGKNISSATIKSHFQKKFDFYLETCKNFETISEKIFEEKRNLFASQRNIISPSVIKIVRSQNSDEAQTAPQVAPQTGSQTAPKDFGKWNAVLDCLKLPVKKIQKTLPKETLPRETSENTIPISEVKPIKRENHVISRQVFDSAPVEQKPVQQLERGMFGSAVSQSNKYVPPSQRFAAQTPATQTQSSATQSKKYIPPSRR